jgi:rSAM/selenodomain-associated transferase 2
MISIIIPVLNEALIIEDTLMRLQDNLNIETIVVDGGSQDNTLELAKKMGAKAIVSRSGRAKQMNAGAAIAAGEILLFLHADTRLPQGYQTIVERTLSHPKTVAGAFLLNIEGKSRSLRLVEILVNWRSHLFSLPYGDQGIFLKTDLFRELGGFADLAIMEDFEMIQRLKQRGNIKIAPAAVITSSRRWEKLGVLRTTTINQMMIIGYYLGISPLKLKEFYYLQTKKY